MTGGWELGIFQCKANDGGVPVPRSLAGWIKAPFALDPRRYDDDDMVSLGWVITHLPTGFIVRGIKAQNLQRAKDIADEVLRVADWDFSDACQAGECGKAVAKVMRRYPELTTAADFQPVLWLEGVA